MGPQPGCVDDPSYKSKAGLLCAQHTRLNCSGFEYLGFSAQEVEELLRKCPVSCQIEPCVSIDDKDTTDTEHKPISTTLLQPQVQGSKHGLTQYIHRRTKKKKACFDGWDVSCQDNPLYLSPMQTDCSIAHSVFGDGKCAQAMTIGFTPKDVNEMLLNCPCGCGIECGRVQPVYGSNSDDSEDGGAIISPIALSNIFVEENLIGDEGGGGFSFQAMMEEYGVFIYAGIGAVVAFIAVIYVVKSYPKRNIENQRQRDNAYSFDEYGGRTEVSGQSRSRVNFWWGYNDANI